MRPRIALFLALLAACFSAVACGKPSEAHIAKPKPVADASADSDSDGLPDRAELRSLDDRQSFRRWFAAIAEMQFYKTSDEWNKEQRDCAGLIRFAWREALRKHDRLWFQRMGADYEPVAADVKTFNIAPNPLGEKLFRTDFGSYQERDVPSGKFSEFADARTLKNFNCVFLGKDRRRVERGDLLFFQQPWVQEFPYHAMIFLGEPLRESDGATDWVVYHTGSSSSGEGVMKKVRLAILGHHPDKRWRPIESNPNFLGFFRLKILD